MDSAGIALFLNEWSLNRDRWRNCKNFRFPSRSI